MRGAADAENVAHAVYGAREPGSKICADLCKPFTAKTGQFSRFAESPSGLETYNFVGTA